MKTFTKRPRVTSESSDVQTIEGHSFTIKCGLRRILKDVDAKSFDIEYTSKVQSKLREIVKSASGISTLMTSLLNYHVLRVMDTKKCAPEITQTTISRACMLVSGKRPESDIDLVTSFNMWRRSVATTFQWPSATGLAKLLDQMCREYLVNCKNHIATNFERFHRRYLRLRLCRLIGIRVVSAKMISRLVWELHLSTTRDHTFTIPKTTDPKSDAKESIPVDLLIIEPLLQQMVSEIREHIKPLWPITSITLQSKWDTFLPWFRVMGTEIELERAHVQAEIARANADMKIDDNAKQKAIKQLRRSLRGARSFSILPHRKPHAIHIPLTNTTMNSIRCTLGLSKCKDKPFDDVFYFDRLHANDRCKYSGKFAQFIRTDGESASVLMFRNAKDGELLLQQKKKLLEKKTVARAKRRKFANSRDVSSQSRATKTLEAEAVVSMDCVPDDMNVKDAKHTTSSTVHTRRSRKTALKQSTCMTIPSDIPIIGLDPGICYPFVAVGVQHKDGPKVARLSNGGFRWMAGKWALDNERKRYETHAKQKDPGLGKYFDTGLLVKTVDTKNALLRAEHDFKCFQAALTFFCQPKVVKLKLRAYQRRQQALDFACRMVTGRASWENGHPIFGKHEKSSVTWKTRCNAQIVAFGDAGFSSCMRGNPPVAIRGFKERLKFHSIVVPIDEYKTSQICAVCDAQLINQTPNVHGVRVCTNSSAHAGRARTYVDRDLNAATNMQRLGVAKRDNVVIPAFVRNFSSTLQE